MDLTFQTTDMKCVAYPQQQINTPKVSVQCEQITF